MNWLHPWMCRPPPEVLINTAHTGRSVLGKRPDLYHIATTCTTLSRCHNLGSVPAPTEPAIDMSTSAQDHEIPPIH